MKRCFETHVSKLEHGTVIEIGSLQKNPRYREIWEQGGWNYVGADIEAGSNVEIVLDDPWDFPLEENSVDAIISGSMLEHNEYFWLSMIEMTRVLKIGGVMIHIAPSRGIQHRAPQDCWRFYRDSMFALAKWTGLECVEATTDWSNEHLHYVQKRPNMARRLKETMVYEDSNWGDTVGVFKKVADLSESDSAKYLNLLSRKISA